MLQTERTTNSRLPHSHDILLTQFIIGLDCNGTRTIKLLKQHSLSFQKAIQESLLQHESSVATRDLNASTNIINAMETKTGPQTSNSKGRDRRGKCFSCGGDHLRADCKFRDAEWWNFKRVGHVDKATQYSNSASAIRRIRDGNQSVIESRSKNFENNLCKQHTH